MTKRMTKFLLAVSVAIMTVACAESVETRGAMIHPSKVEQLKIGESTREDVLALLGSPSSRATFDDQTWYYIGKRTAKTAFLKPETLEQEILLIRFDENDTILEMAMLNDQHAQNIKPVGDKTPTSGNSLSAVEQFISNIGRFNNGATGGAK